MILNEGQGHINWYQNAGLSGLYHYASWKKSVNKFLNTNIKVLFNIIIQAGFSALTTDWTRQRLINTLFIASQDNMLQYLWQEWKTGNGAVVLQLFGSRLVFLNSGLTRACLKHWGTIPDDKDLFMILVTRGIISSKQSYWTGVGMESRSQDFWGISWTTVKYLVSTHPPLSTNFLEK